jgi:predicted branched-subunit amino acid permease
MITLATYRRDLIAGARAMTPWLLGVTPFGLVIGVSAAQSDLPTLTGWSTGLTIYSGSAQMAAINMLDAGAAPAAVIATVLIVNVRLILYGAVMADHWRETPMWWRLVAAYLLVDPSFTVGVDRYAQPGDRHRAHAHYFGGALVLWVSWLSAIAIGSTAGAQLPQSLHLELLIPLYLIGQLAPKLTQAATRRAALTAAAVAVTAFAAPMHIGIAAAILAGIATGRARRTPAQMSTEEASE